MKALVDHLAQHGVPLAGPMGTGKPILGPQRIAFNGVEACGHTERDLGITWPAPESGGVEGAGAQPRVRTSSKQLDVEAGTWFAGALLNTRTCDGDCSHETFDLPRIRRLDDWEQERVKRDGLAFDFCKTAYKPYDLAVTAALLVVKHRVPTVKVSSDGDDKDWIEARQICQHLLGYGAQYAFDDAGCLVDETQIVTVNPARETLASAAARDTLLHCEGHPISSSDVDDLAQDILDGGCYDAIPGPLVTKLH